MSKKPNYVFDTDDKLCHWGIKGQRWGFRRFQNEDGSLTPEGRERYGEGGAKSKSDVQKYKAKVSFKTQQYKADLKSKAQIEKDKRAAKEERNRLKEQAKTDKTLKKEQAKVDRVAKKEQAKTEKQGRPLGMKLTRTKNMSDQDLQKAIDRLKLQAEYNKQYVLATQPNGALAKADRFFEGPTGKVVSQIAINTVPDLIKKGVDYALKEKTDPRQKELDIRKKEADIAFTNANARKANAEADDKYFKMTKTYQDKHSQEVNQRAERMFGTNNASKVQQPKVHQAKAIKGEKWKVEPKEEKKIAIPNRSGVAGYDPSGTFRSLFDVTDVNAIVDNRKKEKRFKFRKK